MKLSTLLGIPALAALAVSAPATAQDDKPVSFSKDIMPIFKKSCVECHNPKKAKGKLDMSTYAALVKGGKKGTPWKTDDLEKSLLYTMVKGPEPEMPEDGDPLTAEQVALIGKWIKQGAKDDTK